MENSGQQWLSKTKAHKTSYSLNRQRAILVKNIIMFSDKKQMQTPSSSLSFSAPFKLSAQAKMSFHLWHTKKHNAMPLLFSILCAFSRQGEQLQFLRRRSQAV